MGGTHISGLFDPLFCQAVAKMKEGSTVHSPNSPNWNPFPSLCSRPLMSLHPSHQFPGPTRLTNAPLSSHTFSPKVRLIRGISFNQKLSSPPSPPHFGQKEKTKMSKKAVPRERMDLDFRSPVTGAQPENVEPRYKVESFSFCGRHRRRL